MLGLYLAYKRLPAQAQEVAYANDRTRGSKASWNRVDKAEKSQINFIGKVLALDESQGLFAGRELESDILYVTSDEKMQRLKLVLNELSPTDWKVAPDTDEIVLGLKMVFMDLGIESNLSCRAIDMLKPTTRRLSIYSKKNIDIVRRGYTDEFVVKSVGFDHELKIACMKMDYKPERCTLMSNYKLLKELVLMLMLRSSTIIKLEGFCLRGDTIDMKIPKKGVLIVTELGKATSEEMFSLIAWKTKLQIGVSLLQFLLYLDDSPIGSLGFEKMQLYDFVMVHSEFKLVDLANIRIGELPCETDQDCTILEMPRKAIQCVQKQCKGRNALHNLLLLYRAVFIPLLKFSPSDLKLEVDSFLSNVQELKMNIKEAMNWFHGRLGHRISDRVQRRVDIPMVQTFQEPKRSDRDHTYNGNNVVTPQPPNTMPAQIQHAGDGAVLFNSYERITNYNFPGRFDYRCPNSRTDWGCVFTINRLDEAKSMCDSDAQCAAFVIFASNPDNEVKMTVVMKNSNTGNPDRNYGSTLFIKSKSKGVRVLSATIQQTVDLNTTKLEHTEEAAMCLLKVMNQSNSTRTRKEGRLFAHLGLKGIDEKTWRMHVPRMRIQKFLMSSKLEPVLVKGGRIKFQYDENPLGLKTGEFIIEYGAQHHHIGFLVAYHLDRILGLYNVPPAIPRKISMAHYAQIQGDKQYLDKYRLFNSTDGTGLQGIITSPLPSIVKSEDIVIDVRENIVQTVPVFSRIQREQLEYVLVWELTKMMSPFHGFLGYKGHLMHFEADLAFTNFHSTVSGYFYNCQFPYSVYKTFLCFKCSEKTTRTVCGLGFEVVRHLRNHGFKDNEIYVGKLRSDDIAAVIDNSASAILKIVEQCVQTFTRQKVLY